jgi:hypothetical protein
MSFSVSLHNSLIRTKKQTLVQKSFSGSSAQHPRSDEDVDEPLDELLGFFTQLTCPDEEADAGSDELFGFFCTASLFGRGCR